MPKWITTSFSIGEGGGGTPRGRCLVTLRKLFSALGKAADGGFGANIDLDGNTYHFWSYRVVLGYFRINALIPCHMRCILNDILGQNLLGGLCPPTPRTPNAAEGGGIDETAE